MKGNRLLRRSIDSRAGAGKEQDEPGGPSGVRKQGHAQKQKDGSMSKYS